MRDTTRPMKMPSSSCQYWLKKEAAGAGVDLEHHLARLEPEGEGRLRIEDLGHLVQLQEVVARAEGAELVGAALAGPLAHRLRVGAREPPSLLAPLGVVGGGGEAPPHRPAMRPKPWIRCAA